MIPVCLAGRAASTARNSVSGLKTVATVVSGRRNNGARAAAWALIVAHDIPAAARVTVTG